MKKKWGTLIGLVFLAFCLVACGKKTLNVKTFSDVAKEYGFSMTDSKTKANGVEDWVIGNNKRGGTIQYATFSSAGSASTFYTEQVDQIAKQTGAAAGGSTLTTTYDGYYYYVTRKGNNVILATVPSEDTQTVKDLLADLPDPE